MITESGIEHDDYLQQLLPGGTPSIALRDFIFKTFSIIDFISPTIKTITKDAYVRSVSERSSYNVCYLAHFSKIKKTICGRKKDPSFSKKTFTTRPF